jgi:regulator of ribosome biosynthesis
MAKVQKASDLVPGLYGDAEDSGSDSGYEYMDEEEVLHEDNADGAITFDLFNMAAFNHDGLPGSTEALLKEHTTHTAELVVKRLFALDTEMTAEGPVCTLPAETSELPREKRIPEKPLATKWEKFAKDKGIQKKKKERMLWDEDQQKYLPRYGYKAKLEGIELHGIQEIKKTEDAYADPFEAKREDKKAKVQKNLKNQAKNQARAGKLDGNGNKKRAKAPGPAEYDSQSMPGLPVGLNADRRHKGKAGVRSTLELVQRSTASMGRFDEARKGEPGMKMRGLKRAFKDNLGAGSDQANMKAQLRHVASKKDKKDKGVTNSLAAYAGIIPDAPTDSFKKSKGKGQSAGPPKKKTKK